jgi:hypothetical protein
VRTGAPRTFLDPVEPMTVNRKAHLRVGALSAVALMALLLIGAARGKATVDPSTPAVATPAPTLQAPAAPDPGFRGRRGDRDGGSGEPRRGGGGFPGGGGAPGGGAPGGAPGGGAPGGTAPAPSTGGGSST